MTTEDMIKQAAEIHAAIKQRLGHDIALAELAGMWAVTIGPITGTGETPCRAYQKAMEQWRIVA